ncbi:MAG: LysM peptidoglycan-binding domain-containing protein [Planctomycetota bacterium]
MSSRKMYDSYPEPQPHLSTFVIMLAVLFFLFGLVGRIDRFLPARPDQKNEARAGGMAEGETAPGPRVVTVIGGTGRNSFPAQESAVAPPTRSEPSFRSSPTPAPPIRQDAAPSVVPIRPDKSSRLSQGTAVPAPQEPVAASHSTIAPVAPDRKRGEVMGGRDLFYTVTASDTLWSIAERTYGNGRYWRAIQEANPGIEPGTLVAGRTIRLPAPATVVGR